MEFPRQEYWNELPFPIQGYLPDPGIKSGSPALQADSLPSEPPGKPFFFRGDSKQLLLLLLLSHVSRVRLCVTPKMATHQAPVPGILQARTLEWVAISFSNA